MKVRLADIGDLEILEKVRFDYFRAENLTLTKEKEAMIRRQLREYYPAHLNRDFFAALALSDGGNLASTAFLVVQEKPANLNFPTGKKGLILNVFTYPDYRRRGYASGTLNRLIDEAKKRGVSFLELSASEMGKPLYKKLGFEEVTDSHFTRMKLPLL